MKRGAPQSCTLRRSPFRLAIGSNAAPDFGAQHVYIFVISPPFDKFPYLNQMAGDWGLYITYDAYVSREFIYAVYVSIITQCDIDDDDYIIRCGHSGF